MNDETPMRTAQAALGFNFPLGLSSGFQIAKTREISALLKGITKIQDYCVDYTDKEIRTSPDIKEDSEQLLHTLGPELWPDREEGKEFPSWLLNAADNPNDHYPGRLYYSDPNDLEILSERFHTFVCLRLANRKRNIQAKARAKNKEKTSTRSSLKRLENPVDEQAHSFVEKSKSCEPEGLDLEPTELQTDKTPHLPPDEIDMRPNIAPTAPMLSNQKNMGDTHSKLCKDNAKCANSSTAGGSTNFGATAVPSHNTASPVNTASSKRNGAKRPNVSSATEARTKRSKCTPNITSTRARTEPTRQQPTQASPPEQDEIFTRPSAPPTSLAADTVDETDHPTIHEPQPNLKDQGVTKGPGTAGQSSVERSPSPLLFGRDHSIQDRDEQKSISDDADEHDSMIEATSHPRPVSITVNDDVGAAPFLSPEQPTETTRSVDEINASLPGVDDQTSYAKNQQLPVVDRIDALDYQYSTELMRMQEQIGEVTSTVNELIAGQKGRIQDADPFGSPEARSSSLDIVMVGRGAQECAIRMKSGKLQVGGIETGDQIFEAFQYQFGHLLTAEQEFSIADVDQVGGPPLDCMRQGFWLKKGSSFCEHWKKVRIELGDMCQREDKNMRVTLGAEMYVTNKKQV